MRIAILGFVIMFSSIAGAQPYINSVDPISAAPGEIVTIAGSGFSSTPAQNLVYLGAGQATVTSATENLLTVTVPANATADKVIVTNLTSGESNVYTTNFILSIGATNFDVANFDGPSTITTGFIFLYDLCACDFDNDGDNDVAITHNETPGPLELYENNSTVAAFSFGTPVALGENPTINVVCADLNSDGFPDLVASEGDGFDELFIFQNTGSGSIATSFNTTPTQSILIPRDASNNNVRVAAQVELADIDGDGKLDIVAGNISDNLVDIFLNTTSAVGGSLTFSSTSNQVTTPVGGEGRIITVGDLNGDNTPELISAVRTGESVYVYRNLSTKGSVNFSDEQVFDFPNTSLRRLGVADLNGDGFMEVAVTDATLDRVFFMRNTTTSVGTSPTFAATTEISTTTDQTWGIAFGDLDGDGDTDVVLGSEVSGGDIGILTNNSTDSELIFSSGGITTTENSRNVGISDLNGDAKPDIFLTSNSRRDRSGEFAVLANRNCIPPTISPTSGNFCNGTSFIVEATQAPNVSYTWEVDTGSGFTTDASSTTNTLDISGYTSNISVRVTMNTDDGSCSERSNVGDFTIRSISVSTPNFTNASTYCAGQTLELTTSATANSYHWTGPNGFEQTTTSGSITVATSAEAINSGEYTLQTEDDGSCRSLEASITIQVFAVPALTIINQDAVTFCNGESTVLSVQEVAGFDYQWLLDGTEVGGATGLNITADQSADYSLRLTDDNGCARAGVPLTITEVTPPTSIIDAATEICTDVALEFTASGTGASGFDLSYAWDIQDNSGNSIGTSSEANPSFTFPLEGMYTANLITGYVDIADCNNSVTQNLTASAPPLIEIEYPSGREKCPSDSIQIETAAGFISYIWVDVTDGAMDTLTNYTGQNAAFINTAEGEDATELELTVTTNIGCVVTEQGEISNFSNAGVQIGSPDIEIISGLITIPAMTNAVNLVATGGSDYRWRPNEIFNDSTSSNVEGFPRNATTEVTLFGIDTNGCEESDMVTLQNDNLVARNGFSPNGDGMGFECWEILNSSSISGCSVYIFDNRGRNILVEDSPFVDDCVWDGNINGSPAPVGIYYYVLKCEESQLNVSGSIVLAR